MGKTFRMQKKGSITAFPHIRRLLISWKRWKCRRHLSVYAVVLVQLWFDVVHQVQQINDDGLFGRRQGADHLLESHLRLGVDFAGNAFARSHVLKQSPKGYRSPPSSQSHSTHFGLELLELLLALLAVSFDLLGGFIFGLLETTGFACEIISKG